MPSLPDMPQILSYVFSTYASLAAFLMLIKSMINDLLPENLQAYIYSFIHNLFAPASISFTLTIDELCGVTKNQIFDAAETYLHTKTSPTTMRQKVGKTLRQKHIAIGIENGEEVIDTFDGILLKWKLVCLDSGSYVERKYFELSFERWFRERVLDSYLPFVLDQANVMKKEEKVVKLYNRECPYNDEDGSGSGMWGSIILDHPATFETIAMDPEIKQMLIDDLDRFIRRKNYYKKVGKAWKRGYLLYGPPGTGKSSLVAAMACHLKFDIYDLDLTSINSNSELKRILLSTTNSSILVIEDIDCSKEAQDRQGWDDYIPSNPKLTLSGILNFIDGLWSSCGDERIIVFTTNHKDRLDPALLRPGRMDMHIHMSYCSGYGFKFLTSNYLGIADHQLFPEIESLLERTEVSPAEVAEELMRNDDADIALQELVKHLKGKIEERVIKDGGKQIQERSSSRSEQRERTFFKRKKFVVDPLKDTPETE